MRCDSFRRSKTSEKIASLIFLIGLYSSIYTFTKFIIRNYGTVRKDISNYSASTFKLQDLTGELSDRLQAAIGQSFKT